MTIGETAEHIRPACLPGAGAAHRRDDRTLGRRGSPAGCAAARSPAIGSVRLPRTPTFAFGRGYFKTLDPDEYRRTVAELNP